MDKETRALIDDMQESIDALSAGMEHYSRLTEACQEVIELLLLRLSAAEGQSRLEFAKAIDQIVQKRYTLRRKPDAPDMRFLEQLREKLLSLHLQAPGISRALAQGTLRPKTPREKLRLVDGESAQADPEKDDKTP